MEFGEVSLSSGVYALLDSSKSQNDLAAIWIFGYIKSGMHITCWSLLS